jgi:hypothetical protein
MTYILSLRSLCLLDFLSLLGCGIPNIVNGGHNWYRDYVLGLPVHFVLIHAVHFFRIPPVYLMEDLMKGLCKILLEGLRYHEKRSSFKLVSGSRNSSRTRAL